MRTEQRWSRDCLAVFFSSNDYRGIAWPPCSSGLHILGLEAYRVTLVKEALGGLLQLERGPVLDPVVSLLLECCTHPYKC